MFTSESAVAKWRLPARADRVCERTLLFVYVSFLFARSSQNDHHQSVSRKKAKKGENNKERASLLSFSIKQNESENFQKKKRRERKKEALTDEEKNQKAPHGHALLNRIVSPIKKGAKKKSKKRTMRII